MWNGYDFWSERHYLLLWPQGAVMSQAPNTDELRKQLFGIVWDWFKENRFYSNWRTLDEQEQWTAKDFHPVTPDNSFGSLAMEVSFLVNTLLKANMEPYLKRHNNQLRTKATKAGNDVLDSLWKELSYIGYGTDRVEMALDSHRTEFEQAISTVLGEDK
jgi:hypothetical protein